MERKVRQQVWFWDCAVSHPDANRWLTNREGGGTKRPTKKPNVFVAVDLSEPQLIDSMKEVLDSAVQFDAR